MKGSLFAVVAAVSSAITEAASTFSPARPPAIPLAVRSPYLNTWLNAGGEGQDGRGNGGYLAGQWPVFWTWVFPLSRGLTGSPLTYLPVNPLPAGRAS